MGNASAKVYVPDDESQASADQNGVDLNVILIKYSGLKERDQASEFKPTLCKSCHAAFNIHSKAMTGPEYDDKIKKNPDFKLSDGHKALAGVNSDFLEGVKEEEFVWKCEFCYFHNILNADQVQKFEKDDVFYLIEKTQQKMDSKDKDSTSTNTSDESNKIIFCIDISGSMNCTHLVEGTNQYISRLGAVQNSILAQIKDIAKNQPNQKVGLVLFSSNVELMGDCTQKPIIYDSKFTDFDYLYNNSMEMGYEILTKPVSQSADKVIDQVKNLQAGGITALGPGLLSSLGMASGSPGSKVIICTDGLANKGLGDMEKGTSEENIKFYESCSDIAVNNGISISVVTIKGSACKVDMLGPMTDRTAGAILRVNPSNLDFGELTKEEMIGTKVNLKAFLHYGLAFKNQNAEDVTNNGSLLTKKIGNVTNKTETSIQYRFKSKQELKNDNVDLSKIDCIPMQAQIEFTDNRGNKYVRVISKAQDITRDQADAEKNANVDIVTNHIQKTHAEMALKGDIGNVQQQQQQWQALLKKDGFGANSGGQGQAALQEFEKQNKKMEEALNQMQKGGMNQAEMDDIQSELWGMKQK